MSIAIFLLLIQIGSLSVDAKPRIDLTGLEPTMITNCHGRISSKASQGSIEIEHRCGSNRPYRIERVSPTLPKGDEPVVLSETKCRSHRDYRSRQKAKYMKIAKQLCDSWLVLDEFSKEPPSSQLIYDQARDSIRDALFRIYREHLNLQGQAKFIDRAPPKELRIVLNGIKNDELDSFPEWNLKYVYRVSKTNSGLFTFMPIEYDHGAFTVTPDNPHYDLVVKHVGRIKEGEIKLVPRLPFRVGNEAFIPDRPATQYRTR